jgi:L-fuconate dehydratase
MVQHLAMFDYLAVSGSQQGRMLEYVDHLHEHFVHPVEIRDGRYLSPRQPGNGAQMLAASLDEYEFGARTVAMSNEEPVP